MKLLKFIYVFILVTNPFLEVTFPTKSNFLRVRHIVDNVSTLWSSTNLVDTNMSVDLKKVKQEMYLEFQDLRTGKIYTSDKYIIWDTQKIYGDYLTKVNSNLTGE